MKAIALVPRDPQLAGAFFGGILGEDWDLHAFSSAEDVPDELAATAEVIIAAITTVDDAFIRRCPNLRLIQVPGHGFEHVDLAAARTAGVPVCTVQSSGAEAHTVAEWTILVAGALSRRLVDGHAAVKRGEFSNMALLQGGVFELANKTIGIVGLGRIGREVAKRARAFDMTVIYFDGLRPTADEERAMGVTFRELDDLLASSDVVTIHVPATSRTRSLIGERELALMKRDALLVNTARGDIVEREALVHALQTGSIRGAALDVFDPEPPHPDDPLLGLANVVLSPHMAGVTADSVLRIMAAAAENCRRLERGSELVDVLGEGAEH